MVWSERSCSGGNAVASASPSTTFKKSGMQSYGPFSFREGRLHGLELLPGAISLWSLVMSGDAWNSTAEENSGEIFVLISFLWLLPLLTRHEHSQANVIVLSSDTYTGIKMGPLVCQNCVDDPVGSKWKTKQSNICILHGALAKVTMVRILVVEISYIRLKKRQKAFFVGLLCVNHYCGLALYIWYQVCSRLLWTYWFVSTPTPSEVKRFTVSCKEWWICWQNQQHSQYQQCGSCSIVCLRIPSLPAFC